MVALLLGLSPWVAAAALVAPIPAFISGSRYGWWGFQQMRRQSPVRRVMSYLTTLMTTDEYAKEVKLFTAEDYFIDRYERTAAGYYEETRQLLDQLARGVIQEMIDEEVIVQHALRDELIFAAEKFKVKAAAGLIVDVDTGKPIVTFPGRRADDVVAWFRSRPQEELARVEVVVLDMSKTYFGALQEVFGDQVQVIDRFHVVQQAVDALYAVLSAVKKQLDTDEAKELKKLRKRWLKSSEQLNVDEIIARYDWQRRFPALRETLAWVQDLRKWFDRRYNKPAHEALLTLIERAHQSAQEPLQRIAGTLTRWFAPIVRYIRNRYTNGMTEGFNNKIKLIQRMAYGLRNEHNRRKRILAWCGAP
jgi:hypothetical protein